jgi:hypothetical protein
MYSCLNYLARKLHLLCAELCCHLWDCLVVLHLSTLSHNSMVFLGEKNIEQNVCFDFLYKLVTEEFHTQKRMQ